jgi:hypothetical protein
MHRKSSRLEFDEKVRFASPLHSLASATAMALDLADR